jgi:hypothetical protein
MKATPEEINGTQIWAGMQAYKINGKYNNIIKEAYEFSKIKECIEGSVNDHRHDQSIFSILSIRHNCPRQNIRIFGEYRGIISPNQVVYTHRNTYNNYEGLLYQ